MRQIAFFFPSLPKRSLSQNARVSHFERAEATLELRADATNYMLAHWHYSPMERALVSVTWHLTKQRPSITKCPRCVLWAIDHQRSNKERCLCYRPTDPFNAVASLKPFWDGFTDAGVWADDTWEHVEVGRFARQLVGALEEEGLSVTIEELEAA